MKNSEKYIRLLNLFLGALLLFICAVRISGTRISAEDNWKGYAVYRDGVITSNFNVNDHAAIMYKSNKGYPDTVIHAGGYGYGVEFADWERFIANREFISAYKPNGCNMVAYRNQFASKTRELIGISYTVLNQITYYAGEESRVFPEYISDIRCDGVVEYIYEWYGFRVGGPNSRWNITINHPGNYSAHQGFSITPHKQREYYLTQVESDLGD